MTVIAAFPRAALRCPEASGALIPRSVDEPLRALSAMSFVDRKWPDRVTEDLTVIRLAVRPDRALAWMNDPEDEIITRCLDALRVLLPAPEPAWTALERYEQGTPQPTPGHTARVAEARAKATALGGITVLGAAWDGPGIAGCVTGAKREAERLAALLG
jgi:oxygen-dependent protoporphyrinogen oxidase